MLNGLRAIIYDYSYPNWIFNIADFCVKIPYCRFLSESIIEALENSLKINFKSPWKWSVMICWNQTTEAFNKSFNHNCDPLNVGFYRCGDGLIFNSSSGFVTKGLLMESPFFEAFRLQGADTMKFSCEFLLCYNPGGCNGVRIPSEY